jgi:penicillin-binding protein 1A
LVESINTVYAPLAVHVGLNRVFALARAAGLQISGLNCFARGNPCDSYALGVPTNPLSEAVAFGTLVNHGVHHVPNSVVDVRSADDGDVYDNSKGIAGNRVMPRRIADAVASVMREVVDSGTGTAAQQPFPVYGKTGTTDNFTNAWFTGCSSTLCISVWMGYDKEYVDHGKVPHSMKGVEGAAEVFGGTLPAQIFAKTFDNYRALKAPKPKASPTPTVTQSSFQPLPATTTPHRSPTPARTHSPTPTVQPSTPAPSSSPSPSGSLIPSPP